MMATGLVDIAELYHITNEAVIGLTLSAFVLSFALGVRSKFRPMVFETCLTVLAFPYSL